MSFGSTVIQGSTVLLKKVQGPEGNRPYQVMQQYRRLVGFKVHIDCLWQDCYTEHSNWIAITMRWEGFGKSLLHHLQDNTGRFE